MFSHTSGFFDGILGLTLAEIHKGEVVLGAQPLRH